MILAKRTGLVLVSAVIAFLCAGGMKAQEARPNALPTTRERPDAFGTENYTVTRISALAFYPATQASTYGTSGSLGRYGAPNTLTDFYANLDLPDGAVIDFIGLNSTTDTPFVLGAELIYRTRYGSTFAFLAVDSTVHGWDTDRNSFPIDARLGVIEWALIVHVQSAPNPNLQFFGFVEVWWKRSVSPAPATATFNDVPVGHPLHGFVEALFAAGITAGCSGGNYCPNAPVTRGQMAVFLSVALGLHWAP